MAKGAVFHAHRTGFAHAGFTLLELAIVLTIIAIIMGGGLSLYAERLLVERVRETNTRLDRIESALKVYVQTFGTLPCPMVISVGSDQNSTSSPALPSGVNPFGRQTCLTTSHNTQLVVGVTGGRTDPANPARSILVGGVPTRTLGIADSYAIDGWNNRFFYAVDNEYSYASKNPVDTSTAQWGPKNGAIRIIGFGTGDEKTNCGGDCPGQAGGIYAVYSLGQNGWGSWRGRTNTTTNARNLATAIGTIAGTTLERENAHVNSGAGEAFNDTFRDINPRQSDSDTTYFDDLVRWKTRIQF